MTRRSLPDAMGRFFALALALCLLALAGRAEAHGARTSYLDVVENGPGEAVASLRSDTPARFAVTSPDCSVEPMTLAVDRLTAARSTSVTVSRLRCPRGVAGATLEIRGLVESDDVVIARVMLEHGATHGAVLTLRAPKLVIPSGENVSFVLSRYVRLGVDHVLSGIDHILFLLALVWQAHAASSGRLRKWASELARDATGFTLAHTATLTATALGWIHVPSEVAETLIAVSLVLIALDSGRPSDATGTPARRLGLVMAFGLVHGLGFASALAEARLPEHAVALGLVAFNVGVELGQLAVIASAMTGFVLLARILGRGPASEPANRVVRRHAATACAYVVGVTGAYLVIARASFFFLR